MLEKPLQIYKASAGSGKTYALVQAYLEIVLKKEHMHAFSRIMAMTFTNKAALEMKERVLKALIQLAYSEPKDAVFIADTCRNLKMDPNEVEHRAKQVLKRILHNFSDLSIQTIDKFNIRLIRSFTRDLDLPGDFEIVLDTDELLDKTIDKLIDSVGEKGKENLSKLLIEFAKHNIDEERSWDFKRSLLEFMKLSEKEEFKPVIAQLKLTELTKADQDKIYAVLKNIEQEFNSKRLAIIKPFVENDWSKDFFKPNVIPLHGRLLKLTTTNRFEDVEQLTEKMLESILKEIDLNATQIDSAYYNQVLEFYSWLAENRDRYQAYKMAYQSFYQLSLLKHITTLIDEIRKRENILQISEVNSLISELIQSESAPFIYERIGTRFDNYLLDEFQDTSRLQWLNLIPLLEDSLGNNESNLIVGDAKQAIYRFRNGLVEQFATLPKIYNPDNTLELARKSEFFESMSVSKTLEDNYRSKVEIVTFNNQLFDLLKESLRDDYQTYYNSKDLIQTAKGSTGGFVHLKTINTKDEEFDNEQASYDYIDFVIDQALNDQYSTGDICILAQKNKHCQLWANYLIEKGVPVISEEGMRVGRSMVVKLMVAFLKHRNTPLSSTYQILFAESYYLARDIEPYSAMKPFFNEKQFDFSRFCNEEFGDTEALKFTYENLYDLSQVLLRVLNFNELDDPYVHYFCNMLLQFDLNHGPDLSRFITYFDDKGHSTNVPLPDRNDAVTIMTSHKSKGLEFPIVVIPDLGWEYGIRSQSQHLFIDEYHDLIYMGTIKKSGTQKQLEVYESEIEANLLDTVNLFYVACTRAVDRLYVLVNIDKRGHALSKLVAPILPQMAMLTPLPEEEYVAGSRTFTPHPHEQLAQFIPSKEDNRLWFPDISLIDREHIDEVDISSARLFGQHLHRVMQEMTDATEMNQQVHDLANTGVISQEFAPTIIDILNRVRADQTIASVILPQHNEEVLNEREIVLSKKERIRPDRVIVSGNKARIIDFKTGLPRAKDEKQIKSYSVALKEMGYESCAAYLLYTDTLTLKQLAE